MKIWGMEIPMAAILIVIAIAVILLIVIALIFSSITAAFISNSPYLIAALVVGAAVWIWTHRNSGPQQWATDEETLMAYFGADKTGKMGRVKFGKTWNTVRIGPQAAHPVKMKNRGLWAFCGEMGVNPRIGTLFLNGLKPNHGEVEWTHRDIIYDSEKILKIDRDSEPIDISIQKVVKERLAEHLEEAAQEALG